MSKVKKDITIKHDGSVKEPRFKMRLFQDADIGSWTVKNDSDVVATVTVKNFREKGSGNPATPLDFPNGVNYCTALPNGGECLIEGFANGAVKNYTYDIGVDGKKKIDPDLEIMPPPTVVKPPKRRRQPVAKKAASGKKAAGGKKARAKRR